MRFRWIAAGVVALLVVAAGGLAVAYPSVAATTCPGCYGLTRVADGLWSERDLSTARKDQLTALAADARRRVGDFYGGRRSDPRLVACYTDECYDRIGGGGEKGIAVLNRAVMLSPRGLDVVIAAHEMSHVELHERLDAEVPQWFDEGLAVVVSDDPRYLGEHCPPPGKTSQPDEALPNEAPSNEAPSNEALSNEPLPGTLSDWLTAASADPQVYSRAGCRVSRWLEANGGPPAAIKLIDDLNRGEPFPALR
ncbi:hypothetical protein [Actinoplanes sp. M2I2]|uniref:hypothetical protein n=1 Tax=Actinoplanes sp. M2I2 TaxID=1734444 RepID=UPI002021C80E|nr:hypothetical protein [Actinoplanes sp. M2I2]